MKKSTSKRLAEALKYYIDNPKRRCKDSSGHCNYSGDASTHRTRGCMVGQFLTPDQRREADKNSYTPREISTKLDRVDPIIGSNVDLMDGLQILHDSDRFWDNQGLNNRGIERVKSIVNSCEVLETKDFECFYE